MEHNTELALQKKLQNMVEETGVIDAAILCTVDGLPITHASKNTMPEDTISAMSASMLALADAMVGQEKANSQSKQVIIESPDRTIAVIHAGENMVLAVLGGAGINIGMVLGHANTTVSALLKIIAASSNHEEIESHQAIKKSSLEDLVKLVLHEAADHRC